MTQLLEAILAGTVRLAELCEHAADWCERTADRIEKHEQERRARARGADDS